MRGLATKPPRSIILHISQDNVAWGIGFANFGVNFGIAPLLGATPKTRTPKNRPASDAIRRKTPPLLIRTRQRKCVVANRPRHLLGPPPTPPDVPRAEVGNYFAPSGLFAGASSPTYHFAWNCSNGVTLHIYKIPGARTPKRTSGANSELPIIRPFPAACGFQLFEKPPM